VVSVIRDVDETVSAWLAELLPGVAISFESPPPREERKGRAAGPTLWLHLHHVRADPDGSTVGTRSLRGDDGVVIGRVPAIRRFRLIYVLTAHAADTLTEHDILGNVLARSAVYEVIPDEFLRGSLAVAERGVHVRCAPAEREVDLRELWGAFRIAPHTALELSVLAPLTSEYVEEVAAPPSRLEMGSGRLPGRPVPEAGPQQARPRPAAQVSEGRLSQGPVSQW
jgi:hypothetical protein